MTEAEKEAKILELFRLNLVGCHRLLSHAYALLSPEHYPDLLNQISGVLETCDEDNRCPALLDRERLQELQIFWPEED